MPGFYVSGLPGPRDTNLNASPQPLFSHRWKIEKLGPIRFPDNLYARTFQPPNLSFEEISVPGVSIDYKIAKKAIWNDITLTFYDLNDTYENLKEWIDLLYDQERVQISIANDHKDTSIFTLLDGGGDNLIRYTLNNSYPKELSHSALSYEESNIKTISLIISYDFATIEDVGASITG